MRIYLCGPWQDRHSIPAIAAKLEAAGHNITERWWEHEDRPGSGYPSNQDNDALTDRAIADFLGAARADALVVVNTSKSEGKAVETGIALSHGAVVVIIGQRSNIFHYLPGVQMVKSIDEAVAVLEL